MPRQKLSEYKSKLMISEALGLAYTGWSIDSSAPMPQQLDQLKDKADKFVVKVDEGVKKRFKNGLVLLDIPFLSLEESIRTLSAKGYRWLIVEPMVPHSQTDERYFSLTTDREGLIAHFARAGGVDIEEHAETVKSVRVGKDANWTEIASGTSLSEESLSNLATLFENSYFTLLEINPYVISGDKTYLLDIAIEVDDAGEFFVNDWSAKDFRQHRDHSTTPEETTVEELDSKSPASFKLSLLNPNGGIFLLLSGGGASVVVADEVYNKKYGNELANYGEYSGNPNTEETYTYTKAVLSLLLSSNSKRKVLFIGGAVANFTDVAKTFKGVIQAIDEVADELKTQNVKVFVRRGGPNQEAGLAMMKRSLEKYGLLGAVHDSKTSITEAVGEALEEFGHE